MIGGVLDDLVPFVQSKTREKNSWRSATFSKLQLKVTLLQGCFSCFLNCENVTKLRNTSLLMLNGTDNSLYFNTLQYHASTAREHWQALTM